MASRPLIRALGRILDRLPPELEGLDPDALLARFRPPSRAPATEGLDGLEAGGGGDDGGAAAFLDQLRHPTGRAELELSTGLESAGDDGDGLEALIYPDTRPALSVLLGKYADADVAPAFAWLLDTDVRDRVERQIRSTGRLEIGGPDFPDGPAGLNRKAPEYAGTAFVVGKNRLLTNRHVAQLYTHDISRTLTIRPERTASAKWDPLRENAEQGAAAQIAVRRILFIHPHWDLALLEVADLPAEFEPLRLAGAPPRVESGLDVVVVGYPGPTWNDGAAAATVGITFKVKQVMPGQLDGRQGFRYTKWNTNVNALKHDASTLGGNSGSSVIDPRTGLVVGLHFAGFKRKYNLCVPTWELGLDADTRKLFTVVGEVEPEPPATPDWGPDGTTEDAVGMAAAAPPPPPPAPEPVRTAAWESLRREGRARYGRYAEPYLQGLDDLAALEAEPPLESARRRDPSRPEIVLLPGILGSDLGRPSGPFRKVWFNPGKLLFGALPDQLALAADGRTNRSGRALVPLQPIELLYGITRTRLLGLGYRVHPFAYDWRRGVLDGGRRLHHFIEQLAIDRPGVPIVLVAHSMGGLVSAAYAHHAPAAFEARIQETFLLGAPLGGAYAVPEVLLGSSFARLVAAADLRSDIDDYREALRTMPGVLDMLPSPDVFADPAHAAGGTVDQLYRVGSWPAGFRPQQRWLNQSRTLKPVLQQALLRRPVTCFVGANRPTLASVDLSSGEVAVGTHYETGDGTVPSRSARLPGARAFAASHEHVLLPAEGALLVAIDDLLTTGACSLEELTADHPDIGRAVAAPGRLESTSHDAAAVGAKWAAGAEPTLEDLAWVLGGEPPAAIEARAAAPAPGAPSQALALLGAVGGSTERPPGAPAGVLWVWGLVDAGSERLGPVWTAHPSTEAELLAVGNWAVRTGWRLRSGAHADADALVALDLHASTDRLALVDLAGLPQTLAVTPTELSGSVATRVDAVVTALATVGALLPGLPGDGGRTLDEALAVGAGFGAARGPLGVGDLGAQLIAVRALVPDAAGIGLELRWVDADADLALHLGRVLLTEARLRLVPDRQATLVSRHPGASDLFAKTGSFAALTAESDRADASWVPGQDSAWVRTWTLGDPGGAGGRYPHAWAGGVTAPVAEAVRERLAGSGPEAAGAAASRLATAALHEPDGHTHTGSAAALQLLTPADALPADSATFVVLCGADAQAVVHAATTLIAERLASFAEAGVHPLHAPVQLAITPLDSVGGAALSPAAAADGWDRALWIRLETTPGARRRDALFGTLERDLAERYPGRVRIDPAGQFAVHVDEGPFRDLATLAGPRLDPARAVLIALADVGGTPLRSRLHDAIHPTPPDRTEAVGTLESALGGLEAIDPTQDLRRQALALMADLDGDRELTADEETLLHEAFEAFEALREADGVDVTAELEQVFELPVHEQSPGVVLELASGQEAPANLEAGPLDLSEVRARTKRLRDNDNAERLVAWARMVAAPHPEDFATGADGFPRDLNILRKLVVSEAEQARRFSRQPPEPRAWWSYIGATGHPGLVAPRRLDQEAPTTLAGLRAVVAGLGIRKLRVTGGGHSASDVARPADVRLDLTNLDDTAIALPGMGPDTLQPHFMDHGGALVRVPAGLPVRDANRTLEAWGRSLENAGSFDGQSLFGAICTGTHGSGSALGPMADQVVSMDVVVGARDAQGQIRTRVLRVERSGGPTRVANFRAYMATVDPAERWEILTLSTTDQDRLFDALVVSLGSMGVVFGLTLRVPPVYGLAETGERLRWTDELNVNGAPTRIEALHRRAVNGEDPVALDRVEYNVNAYGLDADRGALRRTRRFVGLPDRPFDVRSLPAQLRNGKSQGPSKLLATATMARTIFGIQNLVGLALRAQTGDLTSIAHQTLRLGAGRYVAPPSIEVAFPVERTKDALEAVAQVAADGKSRGYYLTSPVGVRFVRSTRALLAAQSGWRADGTFVDRVFTTVEVPMLMHAPGTKWVFTRLLDALVALDGRPHWGQVNRHLCTSILSLWPQKSVDDWRWARATLDPDGLFDNDFTDRVGL